MMRGIDILIAQALRQSMPWLGKVYNPPGCGLPFWFNAFDKEFAPAANE